MIEMREIEMRELIEAELDGVAGGRIPQVTDRVPSDLKSDSWDPHPVDLFPLVADATGDESPLPIRSGLFVGR
jgi:hypothetical protein